MQRIVTGLVPLLFCVTLLADVCPHNASFWVEEKSLDPQVQMIVHQVTTQYVTNDDSEYGHTECVYYDASPSTMYSVLYSADKQVKEVRKLSYTSGLSSVGTICTAPGIYLFKLSSPGLFHGDINYDPTNCGYTFVFHGEECPVSGSLVENGSAEYEEVFKNVWCSGLSDAIAESQKEEYQDNATTADKDTDSSGCALMLID